MSEPSRTSRAVIRFIEAGSSSTCAHCRENVQFRARVRAQQVICNVYTGGVWTRVEHYHRACYDAADAPYGPADERQPLTPAAFGGGHAVGRRRTRSTPPLPRRRRRSASRGCDAPAA